MRASNPNPAIGQTWSWSFNNIVHEIILLTRINSAAHFHGILLYSHCDEYESDVGMETHAEHVNILRSSSDWQRIS